MKCLPILLIVFLFSMASSCIVLDKKARNMKISNEEAIRIANKEVQRLKYDIDKLKIISDEKNTFWYKYISSGPILESNPDIKNKLDNRDFWAIYYGSREMRLGGDVFIFIDKNTGEIILVIQGK